MSVSRRSPSRTAGVLILVCAGLLALILVQLDQTPLSRAARSTPAAAPDRTPVVDLEAKDLQFEMPALSLYSDIEARPLFSPTRRPPPPEETPIEEEEAPAPVTRDLVLRGVATAGTERVALIEERATSKLVRAIEGQSVGGWRVTAIREKAVELEGRGDQLVLELEQDSSPPAAVRQARQRSRQRDAPQGEAAEPQEPADEEQPDRPSE
jgi:general secretion pathway protein N